MLKRSKKLVASGLLLGCLLFSACATRILHIPKKKQSISGSDFYKQHAASSSKLRDSAATDFILQGSVPSFLKKLVPVHTEIIDANGKKIQAIFYVTPDYISIGTNKDWARMPLTPNAAQRIADTWHCFLPTRKMVDLIYHAARVKLPPVPMYAFRDSTPTMYHHHLIIEGQRKGKRGLIAGIKKDVVMSDKLQKEQRADRVAIYGWHTLDGKAIQPLYTGHFSSYVDYSHGIRLVYAQVKVAGQWIDYKDVLRHPVYHQLLCDEEYCAPYTYRY